MRKFLLGIFLVCGIAHFQTLLAADNVVNVYVWSQEIPDEMIQKFEKETGIKVNYSTYDSNETLYTKLRATSDPGYDVVEPSSYYVDRMWREGMLYKLDKTKLSNYKNLDPHFLNPAYDPKSEYSVPYMWGVTGIFINKDYYKQDEVTQWIDLWHPAFNNKLLFLDDPREAFSIALISLGYSANDEDPEHIKQAYLKLRELLPNIKLFDSDAVISIVIDEDATAGMIWNGDLLKASSENKNLQFVFPKDGYVIWVDNFTIPRGAPHLENAYKFINFMLRADVAVHGTLDEGYAIANQAGRNLLPPELKNNPIIYPSADVLKRGQFQTDIGDQALELYEQYWELLKMGG